KWSAGGNVWHESQDVVSLNAGAYEIEFADVAGWHTPRKVLVYVRELGESSKNAFYEPDIGAAGVIGLPQVLTFENVTNDPPYVYNGLIETEFGFGSGAAVKERVVLTAAHVLFDELNFTFAKDAKWYL